MPSIPKPQLTTYPDACAADSAHHFVLYEDDYVRVLRVQYGPHETSAMHGHPPSVIIPLNLSKLLRTDWRGRTGIIESHAWHAIQMPIGINRYENLIDTPFDAVVVELKCASDGRIRDRHGPNEISRGPAMLSDNPDVKTQLDEPNQIKRVDKTVV